MEGWKVIRSVFWLQLPIPPSQRDKLEDSFAFVSEGDCDPSEEGSDSDLAVRLEEQLVKQLMMCKNTR